MTQFPLFSESYTIDETRIEPTFKQNEVILSISKKEFRQTVSMTRSDFEHFLNKANTLSFQDSSFQNAFREVGKGNGKIGEEATKTLKNVPKVIQLCIMTIDYSEEHKELHKELKSKNVTVIVLKQSESYFYQELKQTFGGVIVTYKSKQEIIDIFS